MTGFTPFELADPLAGQDTPDAGQLGTERLRLVEGVMLSADHFETEQLYHRSRRARMLMFLHGAGTVAGLDVFYRSLETDEVGVEVVVTPGLAIDLRGRLVELRFESCVDLRDWMVQTAADADGQVDLVQAVRAGSGGLPDHVVLDVTARFATFAHRPEPAFGTGNADRIDSVEPSLSVDSCKLALEVRAADHEITALTEIADLHGSASVNEASLQQRKREALWPKLSQADDDPLHLARLRVPIVTDGAGVVSFDDSFDITSSAIAPDFAARRYSYSAAELALLSGFRR